MSITATPGPALLNIGDCADDLKGWSKHSLGEEGELFGAFFSLYFNKARQKLQSLLIFVLSRLLKKFSGMQPKAQYLGEK